MKKNILRTHSLPYVQNPKLGNRGKFFFTSNFKGVVTSMQKRKKIYRGKNLKVHSCRFENVPIYSRLHKINNLKISHS